MVGGKVTPEAAYQSAGTSRRGDEQPGSPATMPAFVPNPARESPVPNATSTPENRVTDASPFRITRLRFVRAAVTLIWISAGAQPPLILFREPPSGSCKRLFATRWTIISSSVRREARNRRSRSQDGFQSAFHRHCIAPQRLRRAVAARASTRSSSMRSKGKRVRRAPMPYAYSYALSSAWRAWVWRASPHAPPARRCGCRGAA